MEFDRKGKRKLTDSERLKNQNKVKGSVKKSRYVIIPYDTIETAEEKYGKRSNSKNRFRKGNMKSNQEKSYRSWIKGKTSHSRQMSNPQKLSDHSSAQLSNQQQCTQ